MLARTGFQGGGGEPFLARLDSLNELLSQGLDGCLGPVFDCKFLHYVLHMGLYCLGAYAELLGNLQIGQTAGEQGKYIHLSGRQ
ncbi:MAG TPA: hypothetical protein V6D08_09970 [Candidatus Obscuribacterales bacterium]